ncbi:MAG: hypothetical protein HC905_18240 [Bacteroidales bacterium]|nr:hypothetical protein [Bacteroidales bacterium]
MKNNVNNIRPINMVYLANLDSYDILNNNELTWLLKSNVPEERIIAAQLLRDRRISFEDLNWRETFNDLKN